MTAGRFDEEARRAAHDAVDQIFDHIQRIESKPVVAWRPADGLREVARIDGTTASLAELMQPLFTHAIQLHHPSYMGHQVCPPLPQAVIGDLLISALNQSTAVWEMSPFATVVEKEIVRWLAERAGYPRESNGTAVSGGSAANLTGLMAARARWNERHAASGKRPVIVCSADAHYSIARAAAIMGITSDDVIKVATDAAHRMDLDALGAALDALDPARILAIVGTAGSTATGAFDDLRALAALRDRYDTWLHVDAAHGASVLLSERLRGLVDGLDLADSFAWDPHKMMWMPLSLGIILVRDAHWLRRAFSADAPYLFNADRAGDNIGEVTIQCSKRADAVKLWLTLRSLGTAPIADALDHVTDVTRHLFELVRESDDFEPMHEPRFNIFCFRYKSDDETNARLREELLRSGEAWITSTVLKGQRVLRVTIINPATQREHVAKMLDSIRTIACRG